MTDDLVKELRLNDSEIYLPLLGKAADRIEALEAENEWLRLECKAQYDRGYYDGGNAATDAVSIARAALGETQ